MAEMKKAPNFLDKMVKKVFGPSRNKAGAMGRSVGRNTVAGNNKVRSPKRFKKAK